MDDEHSVIRKVNDFWPLLTGINREKYSKLMDLVAYIMIQNEMKAAVVKLQTWTKDVHEYLESLEIAINSTLEAKELYKGFFIWDSKFINNPKVMFIGINPGTGNPNQKSEINVKECNLLSYEEYVIGENNTYSLARETASVFKKIIETESNEVLSSFFNNKCIKTNFFYLASNGKKDIKPFIKLLKSHGVSFDDFFKKSAYFTIELIKICKPEIVICEGKSVFDYIVRDCYEADGNFITWKDEVGLFKDDENAITYIGYTRIRSVIKNKTVLIDLLKPYF